MLIRKQNFLNRKKPELKVFAFYSKVAKEFDLSIADVDSIYSDYIKQIAENLPSVNVLHLKSLGHFEVNPKRLRATFFKRILYLVDVVKDLEYPKREERAEKSLNIIKEVILKMMKDFESCVICNTNEHTSYICTRNVVGNLYEFVDSLKKLKNNLAESIAVELVVLYEEYAPRLIKHADKIEAKEFMEQYKAFILSVRPELEETWAIPRRQKRGQPINQIHLSMNELEKLYIPEYDIKYYL